LISTEKLIEHFFIEILLLPTFFFLLFLYDKGNLPLIQLNLSLSIATLSIG